MSLHWRYATVSYLSYNVTANSKDERLYQIADACYNSGWTVNVVPSASIVGVLKGSITAFFPGLYIFWTVRIGNMPPTVLIPDQLSFDAFTPPTGYEKLLLNSYNPLDAFSQIMGLMAPFDDFVPINMGQITPGINESARYVIGYDNSNGQQFYALKNVPQSTFSQVVAVGAALQISWSTPTGGGYGLKSRPLKVDSGDPDTNFYCLYIGTGIWNVSAGFADLAFYAARSINSGVHDWHQKEANASISETGTFVTNNNMDIHVTAHSLMITRAYGASGSENGINSASLLPIGSDTAASFVFSSGPNAGLRYFLRAEGTGALWLLYNNTVYRDYRILIPYLASGSTTKFPIKWDTEEAIQNNEAFVLVNLPEMPTNRFIMLGVMKDIFVGNGLYNTNGFIDHDGSRYYIWTITSAIEGALMVKG